MAHGDVWKADGGTLASQWKQRTKSAVAHATASFDVTASFAAPCCAVRGCGREVAARWRPTRIGAGRSGLQAESGARTGTGAARARAPSRRAHTRRLTSRSHRASACESLDVMSVEDKISIRGTRHVVILDSIDSSCAVIITSSLRQMTARRSSRAAARTPCKTALLRRLVPGETTVRHGRPAQHARRSRLGPGPCQCDTPRRG
jgi:hypothetical protein